ncbi:hypothetical protein QNO07_18770 [Streptomyces sp. 549]|uniref:hypothetical protein n=1 Tax=Streptomyces sp. 549 TaxID=3049076 RepID=UPI0024C348D2|nr:hypothetical protein [Streptomyces sp. 549]MDK1475436.1 hypothetical protein [Streptomyces sp. 549]
MNVSAPVPAPTVRAEPPKDRTRLWASIAAVLFLPAAALASVLVLASAQASRCLTYGENCASGLPEWLFWWSAGVGAVALLTALAATALRMRQAALAVQIFAESTALMVILSHG